MRFEQITSHVVWIDQYVSQQNETSTIVTNAMRHINNDIQERSFWTAAALQIVVYALWNELPVERIVNYIIILLLYYAR